VHDPSGRWTGHRRELRIGGDVDPGEILEQLGGAAFGDARVAVYDEVFGQADRVMAVRFPGDGDAGVAGDVLELVVVVEVATDDLVPDEAGPDARDLGLPSALSVTMWASAPEVMTARAESGIEGMGASCFKNESSVGSDGGALHPRHRQGGATFEVSVRPAL
jgi:hypothetical protein